MKRPYDKTTHDGKTVDELTAAALRLAEERLGYKLTITQGSYNAGGVAASGGTHDGGGVVDLAPWDHASKVFVLRRIGFAASFRPELWRDGRRVWPAHIHAVLIGHGRLSPAARAQVAEYLAGGDGLIGDAPDNGPRTHLDARFTWRTVRGRALVTRGRKLVWRGRKILQATR